MAAPWEKYAGSTTEAGPWAKYAPAESVNPAAANPEVDVRVKTPFGEIPTGMQLKGELGESAMFNPAAALIKAGDFYSRLSRGAIQAKEFLPSLIAGQDTPLMQKVKADREFAREPMQQLEAVHPGSTQLGEVAAMLPIPPTALPVAGALEEGSIKDRAIRAGLAYGGNKLAGAAGSYLAEGPQRGAAAQSQNSIRDQVVQEAKTAGYVLPPSASGGGIISRTLEGLSGKAKTEQLASIKNQAVTDALALKDLNEGLKGLGSAASADLAPQALSAVRQEAYNAGYRPIADLPQVAGDVSLLNKLRNLVPGSQGGAIKSPARADIQEMVDSLASQGQWTGKQLVADIQSLREQSRALYGAADRAGGDAAKTALAKAQKEAADLLESLAERNIMAQGGTAGAVKNLRDARTLIAKSHDIEDALINGSVEARKIKGDNLTGGLKTIAQTAQDKAMGKSLAMPVAGANAPITVLDAFGTAGLAAADAGVLSLGLPASRVASRYAILSKPAQGFIRPDYSQSYLSQGGKFLLDNPYAPALAGMYGYNASR